MLTLLFIEKNNKLSPNLIHEISGWCIYIISIAQKAAKNKQTKKHWWDPACLAWTW